MGKFVTPAKIGTLIRALRQDAGLSQEKLAELVGVSSQQIQKYENGQTTLNIIKIQQVATALKFPVSDFFEDNPVRELLLDEQETALLMAFRKIKSSDLKDCVSKLVCNLNKQVR